MTRSRTIQIATIAVLGVALAIAVLRSRNPRFGAMQPATPQDSVYAMLDAARAGNVAAYLDSYAGSMRKDLEQSVRETGAEGFTRYLRDSNAAVKGIAVSDPQSLSEREVSVKVEYVYQDRNEAQTMYLENNAGKWQITRVDGAARVKTLIPYGTPVR